MASPSESGSECASPGAESVASTFDPPERDDVLIDTGVGTIAEHLNLRDELVRLSSRDERDSFERVREFVRANAGRRFDLDDDDDDLDVEILIGDETTIRPTVEARRLLHYVCTERSYDFSVIGKIVFGKGECGQLVAFYTGGHRCYVHSSDTGLLYIVSDAGLAELFHGGGHRHIYEAFDVPLTERDDEGLPMTMIPLAACETDEDVKRFVRDRCGLSVQPRTDRQTEGARLTGYFLLGDEQGLHLGHYFPDRVFMCLADADYGVLGRGEWGLVLVYNQELEVFALLPGARLLKVANSIVGFLRDRLRRNLTPMRRCFRTAALEKDGRQLSVGQCARFACDVDYAVPGYDEFQKWMRPRVRSLLVEKRIPVFPELASPDQPAL